MHQPKTSSLSIVALVLSISSIFFSFLTAIPAIICGIIAVVKISKSEGGLQGRGMAVASIVISGFVILSWLYIIGMYFFNTSFASPFIYTTF